MRRKALPPVEGAEGGEDDSTYSVYGEILLDNRVTAGRWGLDPRTWCPNIISDNHAIDQLKTKKSCKSTLGLHARIVYSSEHVMRSIADVKVLLLELEEVHTSSPASVDCAERGCCFCLCK